MQQRLAQTTNDFRRVIQVEEKSADRVLSHRANTMAQHEPAGVRLDRLCHRVTADGKELSLTPTEFRLLECLLRQPGRAFTRNQLMDVAIGERAIVLERTIDVHVKSLRRKLGPTGDLLETVRGVGYRFREVAE